MKNKICKICGNTFSNRCNSSVTCNEECRIKNIRLNHNRNSKLWVLRHKEQRKEICHNYSINNKEKLAIKSKLWREKNPDKVLNTVYTWRNNNRKKRNAQAVAQKNIKIPDEQLCDICNINKATQRHHEDYNEPLKVKFLCSKCHNSLHLNKKQGENGKSV